jgi:hypothetical protein
MRDRLMSRLKATHRPGVWSAVAWLCRGVRLVSRRRALWSYRLGYALERAGRWPEAGAAFALTCRLAPGLVYRLPDPPPAWDRAGVAFARSLAGYGIRYQKEGALRDLLQRRGRVVPLVPRGTRRRWQRAARTDCATRLHLLYLRHREQYLPRFFARSERYRMPRTWLARAWRWYAGDVLVQSLRLARINGRFVRDAAGVPLRRQLRELLWLSVTLPALPESYYRYELYRPANRARAGRYLHGHENSPVLYELLAEVDNLAELAPLTDKVAFAARAHQRGLAVVPTLAVVEHGQVVTAAGPLPAADLFVKPLAGKRGLGAQKWRYRPERDRYERAGGTEQVPRARFVAWLAERSVGQALIVQPCLANHPDLADLALAAVVTCRIVTMTDEAGRAEPVIATFRMPAVPDAVVDNMHRGGIAAPVALDSGALGAASDYATAGPATRHTRHPASGGLIEGRKLPGWEELRELVCRAHTCFRPRLLVGWDVSLGPDGPLLLEGNERPGVGGLQRLHDTPLGSHRFGELLAHHIVRRFGAPG